MAGEPAPWLAAGDAAARLGVKTETLYAYASRGLVRRRRSADGRRSEYDPADVDRLAGRGRRGDPARRAEIELHSALTAITPRGPAYRGRLATDLAGEHGFESVAQLLLTGDLPAAGPRWRATPTSVAAARASQEHLPDDVPAASRLPLLVSAAALADPLRHDLAPATVVATASSLLATVVTALPRGDVHGGVAAGLAHALIQRPGPGVTRAVDAALVLLADHELAASTLAARTAASARCDPYAVVTAGLAVVGGPRHGAASLVSELALRDVAAGVAPLTALADHSRARGSVHGFGHPLYPDGDPRAVRLLEVLRAGPLASRLGPVDELLDAAAGRGLPPPSIDVALAALTHVSGAPPGGGELVFAVARIAGWIAHALEQYGEHDLVRPRAVYTGPRPA